jgi:hypothetical protein
MRTGKKTSWAKWEVATGYQIDSFLGVTGTVLAPREWRTAPHGDNAQPAQKKNKINKQENLATSIPLSLSQYQFGFLVCLFFLWSLHN